MRRDRRNGERQRLRLNDQHARFAVPALGKRDRPIAGKKRRRAIHRVTAAAERQFLEMRIVETDPAAETGEQPDRRPMDALVKLISRGRKSNWLADCAITVRIRL